MKRLDITTLAFEGMIEREWLTTNGLGGYAASTICGLNTRKYHGLLVAAMAPPVRRMVLLSHVDEAVMVDGKPQALSCNEYPGTIFPQGHRLLRAFSAAPFPRWAYQGEGFTIEKSVQLLRGENTACLSYTLLGGDKSVDLEIHPKLAMRGIHELTYQWNGPLMAQSASPQIVRIGPTHHTPEVFFSHDGEFHGESFWYLNTIYRRENERGYAGLEDLWMPGAFRWRLKPGQTVHLACATEPVALDRVVAELQRQALEAAVPSATDGMDENFDALVRAAEMFVTSVSAEAPAPRPVYVTGQYPWSSPSGRTALIGFPGLFMVNGRFEEGRRLLNFLAETMQEGLIATEFPEAGGPPAYNGADTSLWFVNAVYDYWRYSGDQQTVGQLFGKVLSIIDSYRLGTRLGIHADGDGLISSRSVGSASSWMDARVNEWVVTPRHGRTVELNALWYNALAVAATLAGRFNQPQRGENLTAMASAVAEAFNRRFWNGEAGCCFDVVEDQAVDASIRPNQLLAVSLPNPVLWPQRQGAVIETVVQELLTPVGIRTLSPRDPAYQGHYGGNVIERDRAQHQGSAYPWLLGPLVTAYLRVHGRSEHALAKCREWLEGCLNYLHGDGIGQACELFDGDKPHRPGGAPASALSVAEILRCYVQDILGIQPPMTRTGEAERKKVVSGS